MIYLQDITGHIDIDAILALGIAFVFAFLIGLERQALRERSSMSSHVLVAIASCGAAILQRYLYEQNPATNSQRIIAAVITGMGFLGAGVIIKNGDRIKGLTTASTLWVCMIVSIILGMNYLLLGGIIAAIAVVFVYLRDICRGVNPFLGFKKEYRTKPDIKQETKEENSTNNEE